MNEAGRRLRILVVCTGNVCRSPMAEHILRRRLAGAVGGCEVASAGLYATSGNPATPEAVQAMAEWGLDLSGHRSQPVTAELVNASDFVVVMTAAHREELARRFPTAAGKVRLLTSFGLGGAEDIPDPIGLPVEAYRKARDEIDSAISDFLLHLMEKGELKMATGVERRLRVAMGADHGGFELKEELKKVLQERGAAVVDVGPAGREPVDYPDYAAEVARRVSAGEVDQGILICTTGIGMSIAANKWPGVRAALCTTPEMARCARAHNHANVLALGAAIVSPDQARAILEEWLRTSVETGGRHERRVGKIAAMESPVEEFSALARTDPEVYAAVRREERRQRENLELIASENYASRAVREAAASVLTNKYAEGYPGKRWYHGCEFVDEAERLAIERAKALFGAEHANVQPHSGSQANMAVYFAVMNPGDTMLAMSLAHGGHLTHGHKVNFSGRFFHVVHYGVDRATEQLDYEEIARLAREHKPKLLCAGASAYSRFIDFARLRQIADEVGAYLMVDMAHIAGLVAAGCHPNPVPYCEFVTTTTHKTLRGPRGGMILCQQRFAQEVDRQVFPGTQGGPLMHIIAAKAVCFYEAMQPAFKAYAEQIVRNAKALAAALEKAGFRIVSGGTDNHLMLVDLTPAGVTGKDAAAVLDRAGITVNKNAIPFDTQSPFVTSGIRLGTPAVTTRGMREPEMEQIAAWIREALDHRGDEARLADIRRRVHELTAKFPVP